MDLRKYKVYYRAVHPAIAFLPGLNYFARITTVLQREKWELFGR
jgi:hypothetical protein